VHLHSVIILGAVSPLQNFRACYPHYFDDSETAKFKKGSWLKIVLTCVRERRGAKTTGFELHEQLRRTGSLLY